jgi:hypothetical protein
MVVVLMVFMLSACGSNKTIDNVEYSTYGLLNQDDNKNPNIKYEVIWGNVVWGFFLCETIVAPIYFFGFSLFEPVGKKTNIIGQVVK